MSSITIAITKNEKKFVVGDNIVRDYNKLKTGIIRLETCFQYPDGSYIDLFLLEEPLLESTSVSIKGRKWLLTDLGNTTNNLLDFHADLWATQQARQTLKLMCDSLGVDYENGEFRVSIVEQAENDLTEYILNLCQACIHACCVSTT